MTTLREKAEALFKRQFVTTAAFEWTLEQAYLAGAREALRMAADRSCRTPGSACGLDPTCFTAGSAKRLTIRSRFIGSGKKELE